MSSRILVYLLVSLALFAQSPGQANNANGEAQEKGTADLRARIEASATLPFNGVHFAAKPPAIGWESGAVSWVAVDRTGNIYEVQRGDKADPVLYLDRYFSWYANGAPCACKTRGVDRREISVRFLLRGGFFAQPPHALLKFLAKRRGRLRIESYQIPQRLRAIAT